MRIRIFTLLVAFLAIAGNAVWGQTGNWIDDASIDWYDENKTTFEISTAEQLAGLASLVNSGKDFSGKTIELTQNIDLNPGITFNKEAISKDVVFTGTPKEWTPINPDDVISNFSGTFDGNGFTISGLYLNSSNKDYANLGLFGFVSGTIQNVYINNSYIDVSINEELENVGSIAGHVNGFGKIFNCSFDGLINIEGSDVKITSLNVGGICGSYENETIESCCNTGNINVTMNEISYNGTSFYALCSVFISGVSNIDTHNKPSANIEIKNSYNTGTINVSVNDFGSQQENSVILYALYISGIGSRISSNDSPCNIASCYNTGEIKVSGKDNACVIYIGGINASEANNKITNCYNVGIIESTVEVDNTTGISSAVGSISGSINKTTFNNNYYLPQEGLNAVGGNDSYNDKDGEIEKATSYQFSDGEVAYLLREYGFGQDLQDETITSPTLLCFTPDDAVYKLTLNYGEVDAEKETEEKFVNSKYLGLPELTTEEEGKRIGWFDDNGTEYTSESEVTEDITLTAKVTEQPEEPEQPSDEDDDQGNTGIHKPQRPIKYYNIYVDTICPGLEVEVSKDVVQEGHQVSAYLTIQAECDTTGMRFEYKRGLFGYWKDLKELEGVQPGEYIIKNIYTDIYIRALDATLPEEEPTGIEAIEGAKAYAKDGSIYVYTPSREEVMIIGMSGAIIKKAEQVGLQSYSVSRGIYIVRIGDKVFKLKN